MDNTINRWELIRLMDRISRSSDQLNKDFDMDEKEYAIIGEMFGCDFKILMRNLTKELKCASAYLKTIEEIEEKELMKKYNVVINETLGGTVHGK